ncbi:MAG: recombinase family protein [Gemmataceae bacterium]
MKSGAVVYCRVSTDDQVDNNSLSGQRRDCLERAGRLGCEVLEVFVEEGVSGTREDRPAMAQMLSFCGTHRDRIRYVIVKDIDRFSRDVLVYHALRGRFRTLGIHLYSVNQPNIAEGTAESRLLEAMFSGISQYEHDKILQRTRDGTREAIAKGGWTCYAPYGYRTDRTRDNVPTLAVDPAEAKMVRKAYECFASGMNLVKVTDRLNVLGHRSKRGRKLSFQTIYCVLQNPAYIGKVRSSHFPGRLIDGRHSPIIPIDLWERVQRKWRSRRPSPVRHNMSPDFPLTGTLRCAACDSLMTGSFSRGGTGRRYGYYHCRRSKCRSRNLSKQIVEANFTALLNRIEPTPGTLEKFAQEMIGEWRRRQKSQAEADRLLDKRRSELETKRDRIEDSFFAGKIDEETYRRNLKRTEDEIATVGESKEQSQTTEETVRAILDSSRRFFTGLSNSWEFGLPEHKRRIQRLVFPAGLRCDENGAYRTVDLPPTLAVLQRSRNDHSKLVAQVRTSWNFLIDFMQAVDQFMETTPTSAGDPADAA